MILSQISYLDCIVFVIFLIPQLLLRVPLWQLLQCGAGLLPFLVFRMPYELITERYLTPYSRRSPFCQGATLFQDIVIRCVRYAFANFPSHIGRVFFSPPVALPFTRFRMLRHGYLSSPYPWRKVSGPNDSFKGYYITSPTSSTNSAPTPDIILYYLHGGGFSMGSSSFYLEFLLALCTLLRERGGFKNPAVLGLEYALVPDRRFPTQAHETRSGLEWCILHVIGHDAGRVVVAGDSAGATLALGMLVELATRSKSDHERRSLMPGFVTLLSPWNILVSEKNKDTRSDFLNAETLHLYAKQYAGANQDVVNEKGRGRYVAHRERGNGFTSVVVSGSVSKSSPVRQRNDGQDSAETGYLTDVIASPGLLDHPAAWRRATPRHGFHFVYGTEEVFAPDARDVIARIRHSWSQVESTDSKKKENGDLNSAHVDALPGSKHTKEEDVMVVTEEEAGIHAWPVVNLFLGENKRERMRGVERIVDVISTRLRSQKEWS